MPCSATPGGRARPGAQAWPGTHAACTRVYTCRVCHGLYASARPSRSSIIHPSHDVQTSRTVVALSRSPAFARARPGLDLSTPARARTPHGRALIELQRYSTARKSAYFKNHRGVGPAI